MGGSFPRKLGWGFWVKNRSFGAGFSPGSCSGILGVLPPALALPGGLELFLSPRSCRAGTLRGPGQGLGAGLGGVPLGDSPGLWVVAPGQWVTGDHGHERGCEG